MFARFSPVDWLMKMTGPFATRWGVMEVASGGGAGTIGRRFTRPPVSLPGLTAELVRRSRLLHVHDQLEFTARWSVPVGLRGTLRLIGRGRWRGEPSPAWAAWIESLSRDQALAKALHAVHLEHLSLHAEPGALMLRFAPYGGGVVATRFPPMRYTVSIPPGQFSSIAAALEQLGRSISRNISPDS